MYASIEQEAQPVALGMSVAEGDRAGFFEVLVAERLRHRGLGRQIMETLMAWARDDAGVKTVWLQVVEANTPAVSRHRSFGLDAI